MTYKEFQQDCLKKICNRNTFISKQCEKKSKIKLCFKKYNLRLEKNRIKKENQIIKQHQDQQEKIQQVNKEIERKRELYYLGILDNIYDVTVDEKLIEVYNIVDKRDNFQCVVWNNILTLEEQKFILENFYESFSYYGKILDHAHIESISKNPEKKYNINNIVVMSRFFHVRYDSYENLITGEFCDKNYRGNIQKVLEEYINNRRKIN